jgi:hypothetical protein
MQTHRIHVSGARKQVHQIRTELFTFPEVLEVFACGQPDVLVVVYAGRPRPAVWLHALRAVGYRTQARTGARWIEDKGSPDSLLRNVVQWPDLGDDDGNRTTSSIRNEEASGPRRNAA